ncbi:MAG TPA: hypothetical protein VF406_04260 [Thermodesulfobacteriota bacterium]
MGTKTLVMATLVALATAVAMPGSAPAHSPYERLRENTQAEPRDVVHGVLEGRNDEGVALSGVRYATAPNVVVYDAEGRERPNGLLGVSLPADAQLTIEHDRVVEIRLLALPR